jgi:hypothetical protein
LSDDLEITKVTRRASGPGTWVCGRIHGHRFDALAFPEHADMPERELNPSHLEIMVATYGGSRDGFQLRPRTRRARDGRTSRAIVDFLAAGLAEMVLAGAPGPGQ